MSYPIVHFEIPFGDLNKAKEFYGNVFEWDIRDWPMPDGSHYLGARTTPVDEKTSTPLMPGAINGGIVERSEDVPHPVFAIHVPSIDAMIPKIEAAGGKVTKPKTDIMGMGYYAYISDPDGNILGLWEDAPKK